MFAFVLLLHCKFRANERMNASFHAQREQPKLACHLMTLQRYCKGETRCHLLSLIVIYCHLLSFNIA